MEKKRLVPVGIEDFKEIVSSDFYYVDKTGLIRDLLRDWSKVTLFTRPRRFGKSLNMSMFQAFFELGADPTLFEGLEISKETKICNEYLGKFPVISISLKSVAGHDYESAKAAMASLVRAEAIRHQYVMNSDRLTEYEKNEFEPLLIGEIPNDKLEQSFLLLSQMLYKHHGRKAVMLIDEYDVPLAKAYEYGYYDQMVVLIRNVLHQALKTNENLQFAILTGCMRIAKESIFTGLNNLRVQSITAPQFDEYFGFTDAEVKEMLAYYELEDKFPIVKAWYDGYKFGNVYVYCPWDVINYLYDLRTNPNMFPQNYWINTSGNDIIRRFLDKATATTRKEIEQLIEGQVIEKEVYQELTYAELDKTVNHLWSVLFTTGYLTSHPGEERDLSEYEAVGSGLTTHKTLLKIPNEEIRSIFKEQIMTWFNDQVETDAERYTAFCQAFMDGDAGKIQEMFSAYLREMISIRDTSVRRSMKENFYHGVLLGILNFRTSWYIKSNRESGEGFNDIMIMDEESGIGMIIEVKYAENSDLDAECAKALAQIETLHYTDVLDDFEPTKIYKYAIACYKKRCKVVVESMLCT